MTLIVKGEDLGENCKYLEASLPKSNLPKWPCGHCAGPRVRHYINTATTLNLDPSPSPKMFRQVEAAPTAPEKLGNKV